MSVDVSWKHWAKLSNDHTQVSADYGAFAMPFIWTGNASTSNLPILMMTANSSMSAKPDGSDIRFTSDAEGLNELAFDVVNFSLSADPVYSRAEIWAVFPSISSVIDVSIYMWWGNSSATAYESSATYGKYNTYTGWSMVYHGNGSGDMINNKSALHTFTNHGTTEANGIIGKCRNFDGISNYLSNSFTSGVPNFSSSISIMGWVKWNALTTDDAAILNFGISGAHSDDIVVGHQNTNDTAFHLYGDGSFSAMEVSNGWGTSGVWKHFIFKYTESPAIMRTYINSVEIGTAVSGTSPIVQNVNRPDSYIGLSNWIGNGFFNGQIDELRIGTGVITNAYISIAYAAQSSPHTFTRVETTSAIQNWSLKQLRNELANTMLQTRC